MATAGAGQETQPPGPTAQVADQGGKQLVRHIAVPQHQAVVFGKGMQCKTGERTWRDAVTAVRFGDLAARVMRRAGFAGEVVRQFRRGRLE